MAAFNHRIVRVGTDEANGYIWRNHVNEVCRQGRNRKTNPEGCGKPVEFVCMYDYVTGSAGRVTDNRKGRCREHAAQFAKKHGLELPG